MHNESFNIFLYLAQVAPVVVVMGVACYELWKKNNSLIDKLHQRDLENLKTLEAMLFALRHLDQQGQEHFKDLKNHISDRLTDLYRTLSKGD